MGQEGQILKLIGDVGSVEGRRSTTPAGQWARAVLEGWTAADGKLPVNRSGGLTAKGHPIGATGASMHVISAMQLTGTAGAMQLPCADIGGVFTTGGASYVSILAPRRG